MYKTPVIVVDYNPIWAQRYLEEKQRLTDALGKFLVEIEHIGSTAIPNQKAKPIIDIMLAIQKLEDFPSLLPNLEKLGYQLQDVGMKDRHFLQYYDQTIKQHFHLHIVTMKHWSTRKERLMRDYLLEHPQAVQAYGCLKEQLAQKYPNDSLKYTQAKTQFIQALLDKAYSKLGLDPIDVWNDD